MMNKKIGFIGCGNMAQAMIAGMIKSELVYPEQIIASAVSDTTLETVKNKYNILTTKSNVEIAKGSEILFLAVKPHLYSHIINEVKDAVNEETIVVSIAAGVNIEFIEKSFEKKVKVVRTMPNTPSLVGEGMGVICSNELVTKEDLTLVTSIFKSFGKAEIVSEKLLDAIPAISGSSPAYVYMFIEAMADGGVRDGIPRQQAYQLAAQSVLGAAKMVLETNEHPGKLKDNVCSPGGSTIEAVTELEKSQLRAAVLSAMEKCTEKVKKMSAENK